MFINFIITGINEYENTKCVELTDEEKKKINKKLVDEIEID